MLPLTASKHLKFLPTAFPSQIAATVSWMPAITISVLLAFRHLPHRCYKIPCGSLLLPPLISPFPRQCVPPSSQCQDKAETDNQAPPVSLGPVLCHTMPCIASDAGHFATASKLRDWCIYIFLYTYSYICIFICKT